MKTFIIIFLLIIILFLITNKESFNPSNTPKSFIDTDLFYRIFLPGSSNTTSIYENRFGFIPTTINDNKLNNDNSYFVKNYDELKSNKCCLVKKILDNNDGFRYTYTPYTDNDCSLNNFELDQNNQLLFEGQNGWSNSYCSTNTTNLGSCQHYNFECIDFVSKDKCYEYNNRMPPDPQKRKITFNWNQKPCFMR
tara:strand:- start:482 stop:1063 length:582 start_codon:yes stop_codon:yes gene_type:complete